MADESPGGMATRRIQPRFISCKLMVAGSVVKPVRR